MRTEESIPAASRAAVPLLILFVAAATSAQEGPFPIFAPEDAPDSLNVERVGEIVLAPLPREGEFPYGADLYLAGDRALMGDFRGLVHIVDISDPAAMRKAAEVPTPGPALDIKIAGDLAVIGVQANEGDFGLLILDISDPENPAELSRLEEPGWGGVHNLFIHGDRLYLAHMASPGVSIVDISVPAAPVVSGFWQHGTFSNAVHDVFIGDGVAAVSDFESGLVLLDLTDPDAPALLAEVPFPEGIHSAWAEGGYVYCNQEFGGWERRLHVVDIADPRRPRVVHSFGSRPPPHRDIFGPHNPWVRDGLLYWAYYDAGLRVFDLGDPARPVEVGYHTYPGFAWSVTPHDDGLLYVADATVGIQAYRLDDEAMAGRTTTPMSTAVAGGEGEADARPSAFNLAQNFPNPFNQSTVIRVDLETGADMELAVYNMSGQKAATLARGPYPAGTHSFTWEGRTTLGRELASGVYTCRLSAGGQVQTRKLILLR